MVSYAEDCDEGEELFHVVLLFADYHPHIQKHMSIVYLLNRAK